MLMAAGLPVPQRGVRPRLAAGRRREDVEVEADRHRAAADHRRVRLATRSATTSCARSRSGRTARSAGRTCRRATTPSSPTASATWPRASSRWSARYFDGAVPAAARVPGCRPRHPADGRRCGGRRRRRDRARSRSTRRSPPSGRSSTSSTATSPTSEPWVLAKDRGEAASALDDRARTRRRRGSRARRAADPGDAEGDRRSCGPRSAREAGLGTLAEQPIRERRRVGAAAGAAARSRPLEGAVPAHRGDRRHGGRVSDSPATSCGRASRIRMPIRLGLPAAARGARRAGLRQPHAPRDRATADRTSRSTPREQLDRASSVGVRGVVQVGTDLETSRWSAELASHEPRVLAAVALHPNEAPALADAGTLDEQLAEIAELAGRPRVRAVGETGLDFFRTDRRRGPRRAGAQRSRRTSRSPRSATSPCRSTTATRTPRCSQTLRRVGAPERTVFHCFSGDAEFAKLVVRRGLVPVVRRHRHVQERRPAARGARGDPALAHPDRDRRALPDADAVPRAARTRAT